jgi:hypothetical protein
LGGLKVINGNLQDTEREAIEALQPNRSQQA